MDIGESDSTDGSISHACFHGAFDGLEFYELRPWGGFTKFSPCCCDMSFEGSEKRLEIDFSFSPASSKGLRQIPRSDLDQWMQLTQCVIISSTHHAEFDAYVLSESSLFITPTMAVLKTCGTTRILNGLPLFLETATKLGMIPKRVKYSRASFLFPDEQYDPHRRFENEVAILHDHFNHLNESSYVLGNSFNGLQWHLYHACNDLSGYTNQQSVEMVMTGLRPSKASQFFRINPASDARTTTHSSGIADLLPGAVFDDHMFNPCGYSLNGLSSNGFITVHVTPEDDCSYASVEFSCLKTIDAFDVEKKLEAVIQIFDPEEIYVSMHRHDARSPMGRSLMECPSHGTSIQYLGDGSSVAFKPTILRSKTKPESKPEDAGSKFSTPTMESGICISDEETSGSMPPTVGVAGHATVECIGSMEMTDYMQRLIRTKELTQTFAVVDLTTVRRLYLAWRRLLPRVEPFYAVKCFPDRMLMRLLASMGASFDCASREEIQTVMDLGVQPSNVIFANACKHPMDMVVARGLGIDLTTFDMPQELEKLHRYAPDAHALIRIRADDPGARCQLGNKYGAEMDQIPHLYQKAKALGITVVGVSFHVGSGATNPEAFVSAIELAKHVFDLGSQFGFQMSILDIGGGFCSGDVTSDMSCFVSVSSAIDDALNRCFPLESGIRVIAEPGRYFAETCLSLSCAVIGVKERRKHDIIKKEYWITDGLYGAFNCIPYDHTVPEAIPLYPSHGEKYPSTVFGPTCDGLDIVLDDVPLRELSIGDWLYFPNMGAYTLCGASNFNGMHKDIDIYYVWTD